MDCRKVESEIVGWMSSMMQKAGSAGLVFGLSGGLDSALVAALAKKAAGDGTLALIMPCESHPLDTEHAVLAADAFDVRRRFVELTGTYRTILKDMGEPFVSGAPRMARANLKPRLRMAALYYFANSLNCMVVGTGNRSEWYVGYSTKFGDSGVDMQPVIGLLKTEIIQLSRHMGVPEEIIAKPPTAGLWQGQTDEGEMGFTYEQLDRYIETGEADDAVKARIDGMHLVSRHKYMMPPTPFPPEEGLPARLRQP